MTAAAAAQAPPARAGSPAGPARLRLLAALDPATFDPAPLSGPPPARVPLRAAPRLDAVLLELDAWDRR